ncbi:MAG: hypothetical protein K6G84_05885 [Lachnospiraceae bacterium]|nr:hypothetical protein [Lachnospiraceae bacterium]
MNYVKVLKSQHVMIIAYRRGRKSGDTGFIKERNKKGYGHVRIINGLQIIGLM